MSAAIGTPATRGVPGEVLRVDFRERFARGGIAARCRQIGDLMAVGAEEDARVLTRCQHLADERAERFLARLFGLVRQSDETIGPDFAEDRVDVVFRVAIEPFEAFDLEHLAIATEDAESFRLGPFGKRAVMTLAGADERGRNEERPFLQ